MWFRAIAAAFVLFCLIPADFGRNRDEAGIALDQSFCERNPHTCAATGELWEGFSIKARALVGLTADVAGTAADRMLATLRALPGRDADVMGGTLNASDRTPGWRFENDRAPEGAHGDTWAVPERRERLLGDYRY